MHYTLNIVTVILLLVFIGVNVEKTYEYPPYDGWYNNLNNPALGAADTQLFRRIPPAYKDGVYQPSGHRRPNPINISDMVFGGSTGRGSTEQRTAFLVFFGQQVVEEILDAQRPGCPVEYFNLKIPKGHAQYDPEGTGDRELPIRRTRYDFNTGLSPNAPRQQLNEITPYIDGTLVYGPNKAWADALRKYEYGLLASTNETEDEADYPQLNDIRLPMANPPPPRDHYLKPIKRFWKLGNPRGNENTFLLSFGILWYRFHNYRARQLRANHPDWRDEKLFNEARKWTIAVQQNIIMYEWLPAWLGQNMPDYEGYDPTVNPQISHVFQSAAMRFGHTLVPPGVYRRDGKCTFIETTKNTTFAGQPALRTCNVYWNPQEGIREQDIDALLMGMASQHAEKEDMTITPDLKGDVFGPLEFSRRDLMAINIQRGRDHGLPDYNTARMAYGLDPVKSWDEFGSKIPSTAVQDDPTILDRFRALYGDNLDDVDIWPAGMLETFHGPGELFTTIIKDQFLRIRNADRFWFENYKQNGLFTEQEVEEIKKIRIYDIVLSVTKIKEGEIQEDPFHFKPDDPCFGNTPGQLRAEDMENCTEFKTFDYFTGSEASYALSVTGLLSTFFIALGVLFLMAKVHEKEVEAQKQKSRPVRNERQMSMPGEAQVFSANEYVGKKEGERQVVLKMCEERETLTVLSADKKKPLRVIDYKLLRNTDTTNLSIKLSTGNKGMVLAVEIPIEYDLILKFDTMRSRDDFFKSFKTFSEACRVKVMPQPMEEKMILNTLRTKSVRMKQLEKFFKNIFNHAFHYEDNRDSMADDMTGDNKYLKYVELTKEEFAEALALKPNSLFVENMFEFADQDNNGYLGYHEFLNLIVIFSKGTAEQKGKLMFDMYDSKGTGVLSQKEFKNMLVSLMELANEEIEDDKIGNMIETILKDIGLNKKDMITFTDFQKIMKDYQSELSYSSLSLQVDGKQMKTKTNPVRAAAPTRSRKTIRAYTSQADEAAQSMERQKRFSMSSPDLEVTTIDQKLPKSAFEQWWLEKLRFIQNYRLQIFWGVLYTLVSFGIFAERAYYYSIEREHGGLRQIAGYGVTVTRGAASGMMFTYSCLLVTMCRNLITQLRETFLHRYIPFDSAISAHKYIAYLAAFFTVCHIIGHCINFYHIATQPADDLSCLFRNFFHATDELPKFHDWMWKTITGFTGVLLTVVIFIMYIFATQYARRHTYKAFWWTHHMHIILWILTILHGAGRLVQPPFFHYFFLGPVILWTLDKLVSISRKKVEIAVVKAELLPSDVTMLEIKRPQNFEYLSGQWVRIACLPLGSNEYHPFTLSSAPHEENITLHIRAVGPWTMNLRRIYDPAVVKPNQLPKVFLDGPYGEGHQDWYRYEVAILVGGGIGVTPFASILKDIAHRSKNKEKLICKKVYFLWVTRTQKQFEWMTDIIREVEENDLQNLVDVHIFITQFKEKFDVRTTMLYICERYFQKISGRSLFTGLRSITHFGRPDFTNIFEMAQTQNQNVNVFGVFSCGPPPMTAGVEKACAAVNKYITNTLFVHHYENF